MRGKVLDEKEQTREKWGEQGRVGMGDEGGRRWRATEEGNNGKV